MIENQTIHSFDATFSVEGEIYTSEKYRELYSALSEKSFVSRGAGVSYPLLSAGQGSRSVSSLLFNRILEFDANSGAVKVESGASVGKLLQFLSERGWWLPTVPGHPSITIGGCIAVNSHGKSQYHSGLFSDSVLEMELFHPKHGKMKCGPVDPVFHMTVGGFGLTGHIISAKIQCKRKPGQSLVKISKRCSNLFECIDLMTKEKDQYDQVYSWNDLNRRGISFGAGFVYCEKFSSGSVKDIDHFSSLVPPPRSGITDRLLSLFLKNQVSRVYSLKERISRKSQHLGTLAGAFPINGKEVYHRLFGRDGLLESQILIPQSELKPVFGKIAEALDEMNQAVSLGSMKIFHGKQTLLNFQRDGICLALNVPNSSKANQLFAKIDQICKDHFCLPNIAKDSRLNQNVIEATYPEYAKFKSQILQFDPQKTIQSALRERLGL